MRPALIGLIACVLVGCGSGGREYNLAAVGTDTTIVLGKAPGQSHVHALDVTGRGRIDGAAELALILNGERYKVERLEGDVAFTWSGDWYSDSAVIDYRAGTARSGNLTLEYRFRD